MEFKDGDKVRCAFYGDEIFTVKYKVVSNCISITRNNDELPYCSYYMLDGRYHDSHTTPVLTLVERPKKMVKKRLSGYVNMYLSHSESFLYETRIDADEQAGSDRIACVFVTGEYEVEE